MKESDLNRDLVASVNLIGKGYKIPDPPQIVATTSNKRPFDWFGSWSGSTYFVESKLMKAEFTAFPLNRVEDHQYEYLLSTKKADPHVHTLVAVAYWVPRRLYEVIFFDILYLSHLKENGVKSIKKKEMLSYRETGNFLPIKKHLLDVTCIPNRIVYG